MKNEITRRMAWGVVRGTIAAMAMTKGGFQHIVVVDERGTVGITSMRDLVRSLTSQ